MNPEYKMPQHCFGYFKIGDDTLSHRSDGNDVARCSAKHSLGLCSDCKNFFHPPGIPVDCHDRRLAEDDPLPFHVDQSVCRP